MKRDLWGISCSILCLVHCLITLLASIGGVAILAELAHGGDHDVHLHAVLIIPIALFALLSFPACYKKHRNHFPLIMAIIGLVGIMIALLLPPVWETVFTVVGSLFLVAAHGWNYRLNFTAQCL